MYVYTPWLRVSCASIDALSHPAIFAVDRVFNPSVAMTFRFAVGAGITSLASGAWWEEAVRGT